MMNQHAPPFIAFNHENIVPTVKNNTADEIKEVHIFLEIEVHIFESQRCISFMARGAYL